MQTVVNPVQVVSDFLKSEEGLKIMTAFGKTNYSIAIGAIDDATIVLEKDGFKTIRNGGQKEAATAYDVFGCFAERTTGALTVEGATAGFRNFVMCRICLISA